MKRSTIRLLAVAVAVSALRLVVSGPAFTSAGIISTTGTAEVVAAPASVLKGVWESNALTRVFQEQTGIALSQDVQVDISAAGLYNNPLSCTGGVVAAGTTVDSFLVHQDAIGRRGYIFLQSSITFDQDILGVIVLDNALNATDPLLGAPGTRYPTGTEPLRALDFPQALDRVTVSEDRRTIFLDLQTQVALDHIRIITASSVPGPGSTALLILAGLTAFGRRRRSTR